MTTTTAAVPPGTAREERKKRTTRHPGGGSSRWGLAILIVAVGLFVQTQASNFLTSNNIETIILNVSSMMIAAAAAMRLLVAGNVDLSIGGQFSLISVVTALVARDTNSAPIAVAVALGLGTAIGLANGVAVRLLSISPLIVTLGVSFVYYGLANAFSHSQAVFGFPNSFLEIGLSKLAGVPTPVWIALIYFGACALWLTRTTSGIRRFAIGGNPIACRSEGINVDRAVLVDFVFMGFTMGLVALLATAHIQSGAPDIGINFELETLTAVIVGGVAFNGGAGRPLGVFLGVMLLGTIDAAMVFLGYADYFQQIAKGAILLLALAADQLARYRARVRARPASADYMARDASAAKSARLGNLQLSTPPAGTLAASIRGVSKRYGTVQALNDISFEVRYGEITCLVGDNGAGKSTLVKVLAGAVPATEGDILINTTAEAHPVKVDNPRDAGVETVWQDLALCQNMGAAYNLSLGNEPSRGGLGPIQIFDRRVAEDGARRRLAAIGVNLADMFRPLSDLSGGQRQSVSIGRVVTPEAKVVILDEPTAALGVHQTQNVVALIRELAAAGAAVLLVSHDIEIIREVADHYIVLNRGRLVADSTAAEMSAQRLVHLMAGLAETAPPAATTVDA
jgi:ribose/xylose/arabinose/galactoside ABC-type transport system permease subunit/ABC-type branched-subunit amino acid transport system ATPase component